MNNNFPGTVKTVRTPHKKDKKWPYLIGCLGITVITGIVVSLIGYFYLNSNTSSQSVVYIREPAEGSVIPIGEPVLIRALARNDQNITQIELWVDDQLIDVQTSQIESGINPFPLLTYWYPTQPGTHTVSARATDNNGNQSINRVTVNIMEQMDRDADGLEDAFDQCPDQSGPESANGCPDQDFDGISDDQDACPNEVGLPENGCPAPSEEDQDGDGILNDTDLCPDETGTALTDGCPDLDGDGVANAADACPAEAGSLSGCPNTDNDGDGIPDLEDACPATSGSAANNGCPEMPGGVMPPPPDPGDDPPEEGSGSGLLDPQPLELVLVQTEAYEMFIREPYDHVWCYLTMNEHSFDPITFSAIDQQYWDIAAELAGENSKTISAENTDSLTIQLSCLGQIAGTEPVELINREVSHPSNEWDGREQFLATDSNDFLIRYHICSPSCDAAAIQAPALAPITTGPRGEGPYEMRWQWSGDEDSISGFALWQKTDFGDSVVARIMDPHARSIDMADFQPACNETAEFQMYAFGEVGGESYVSPYSNTQSWLGTNCTHTALINFRGMTLHDPPVDTVCEGGIPCVGPIYGDFSVNSGSTVEQLSFSAMWHSPAYCYLDGLWLQEGDIYVRQLFTQIHNIMDACLGQGCHSDDYFAPDHDYIIIEIDEGEDITLGAHIIDMDVSLDFRDTLIDNQLTVQIDDYNSRSPMWVTIEGRYIDVTATVTILPSP